MLQWRYRSHRPSVFYIFDSRILRRCVSNVVAYLMNRALTSHSIERPRVFIIYRNLMPRRRAYFAALIKACYMALLCVLNEENEMSSIGSHYAAASRYFSDLKQSDQWIKIRRLFESPVPERHQMPWSVAPSQVMRARENGGEHASSFIYSASLRMWYLIV